MERIVSNERRGRLQQKVQIGDYVRFVNKCNNFIIDLILWMVK